MAKKREITIDELNNFVAATKAEKPEFNKTTLSIDFMDSFVGMLHPEDIDKWVEKCLSIKAATRKDGKEVKDVKAVREYFIATYFPDFTDEALEAAKEARKQKRIEAKAEKDAIKAMTPQELFKAKMEKFKK